VTTRPIPTASPRATKAAWCMRQRSSRRRYVIKNIEDSSTVRWVTGRRGPDGRERIGPVGIGAEDLADVGTQTLRNLGASLNGSQNPAGS